MAGIGSVARVAANWSFFELLRSCHRLRDASHIHRPFLALRDSAALFRNFNLLLVEERHSINSVAHGLNISDVYELDGTGKHKGHFLFAVNVLLCNLKFRGWLGLV